MARIADLKKMCSRYDGNCINVEGECPLKGKCIDVNETFVDLPDNIDNIVEEWLNDHPVPTYAEDFTKKFPNCRKSPLDNRPMLCRNEVYGITSGCMFKHTDSYKKVDCSKCWNERMKDE